LDHQVQRLADLVDQLSARNIRLKTDKHKFVEEAESYMIVSRSHVVLEECLDDFSDMSALYLKQIKKSNGYRHHYVTREGSKFTIYEVWESDDHLKQHYRGQTYRTFVTKLVAVLGEPVETQSMSLPSAWFEE